AGRPCGPRRLRCVAEYGWPRVIGNSRTRRRIDGRRENENDGRRRRGGAGRRRRGARFGISGYRAFRTGALFGFGISGYPGMYVVRAFRTVGLDVPKITLRAASRRGRPRILVRCYRGRRRALGGPRFRERRRALGGPRLRDRRGAWDRGPCARRRTLRDRGRALHRGPRESRRAISGTATKTGNATATEGPGTEAADATATEGPGTEAAEVTATEP